MIARIAGVLLEAVEDEAIVDCQGVGYRITISLLTSALLPKPGTAVSLRIRTVVREDAFDLYGFLEEVEERLFLLLTSVSGVGPKVAMNVLSGIGPHELAEALRSGNVKRLTGVKGIGKKTAERLVLELREKVGALALVPGTAPAPRAVIAPPTGNLADLLSALGNLGYRPAQTEKAAAAVLERLGEDAPLDKLLREALLELKGAR